ncbi:Uncharacterised protein [uncultured archaeon]|nr:Uncharacterised protein [uncultured archaeon]
MKISKETLNFNKELLIGEIGTLAGIQFVDFLSYIFSFPIKLIPHLVVFGAIIGGSLFWVLARIYYKSKEEKYSEKKFLYDIKYFTPASAFFTFAFYYPALFFATKYFLFHHRQVEFSTIISQIIAFGLFLIGINFYRYILLKVFKKQI